MFFRQYKDNKTDLNRLSESDFHHKDTSKDICIRFTFKNLPEQDKLDLSDYVRLDKLTVSAVAKFDAISEKAKVKQFVNRLGFEDFRKLFENEKNSAKVGELKKIFNTFKLKYTEVENASSKADMIKALHDYEEKNPDICI